MSFATGFVKGFGDSIKEGIEENTKRMNDLLDQGISNAKAAAPGYMETKAELKSILEIGDSLKRDYNITDEEFVALAQATDITTVYANILKESEVRKSRNGKIRKSDILSAINIPDNALPEGMSREQAIAQMLGLQGASLAEEDDPNSEGAQTRSLGKSIARMLALNPKLTAEERLKTMKVMGVDVSDLQYYMSTQGVKQTVIPGATRTRDIMFEDLDYNNDTYTQTSSAFRSRLTKKLAGVATDGELSALLNNPNLNPAAKKKNAELVSRAQDAGDAIGRLELGLVNSGSSFGLIGSTPRRLLFDKITARIEQGQLGIDQLSSLIKNIDNGTALETITSIFKLKGEFSNEDITNIINGVVPEGTGTEPEVVTGTDPKVVTGTDPKVVTGTDPKVVMPDGGAAEAELDADLVTDEIPTDKILTDEPEEVVDLRARIAKARSSEVRQLLQNDLDQLLKKIAAENKQEAFDTKFPDASSRARDTLDKKESLREAMADYTKDEWKSMSRSQREEAGLPVTGFDLGLAGGSAFKIEVDAAEANAFLEENQRDILNYLLNKGFTGEEADKEYELAIAGWFDEQRKSGNRVKKIGSLNEIALGFKGAMALIKADKDNKE